MVIVYTYYISLDVRLGFSMMVGKGVFPLFSNGEDDGGSDNGDKQHKEERS